MATVDPRTIDQNVTNTRNDYYDLVSVLYHALEGARTHAIYRQDAISYNDRELALFFEQCQQNDILRAERAKLLLATRAPQHISNNYSQRQAPTNPPNQQPSPDQPERGGPMSDAQISRSFDE